MPAGTRKRWAAAGRLLARIAAAVGLAAVFTCAAAVGVILHIDIGASRAIAARQLSRILSDEVYGTIEIESFDHLHYDEVAATGVNVRDESGNKVLSIAKLVIAADVPDAVWKLLFEEGKVSVVLHHVRAERADCELVPDPRTGEPSIGRALTPKPGKPKKPRKKPPRYLRVWLPTIEIGQAWARGKVGDLPMLESSLRSVKGSLLVTPKGLAVDVQRFGTVLRGIGGADASGTGSLHVRAPGRIWTYFDGFFGDVGVGAFVEVHRKKIRMRLELPNAGPEAVRALLPDWPLYDEVAARIEASGELPELQTHGTFSVGGATLHVTGPLTLAGDVGAKLMVSGGRIDVRSLWPDAPKTSASAESSLDLWVKRGKLTADVNGWIAPSKVGDYRIPAIDVLGRIEHGGFKGRISVHEPGMPVRAALTVHPDGVVDVDADARSFFVQHAPRLHHWAKGLANVRVVARVEQSQVDARVTGSVEGFELAGVRIGRGRFEARARGPLREPEKLDVDAALTGSDLAAGLFRFDRVSARAVGKVTSPRVHASFLDRYGPNVKASAVVSAGRHPTFRNLELAVERDGARITGRVVRLEVGRGEVDLDHLSLQGAGGELRGSLRVRPRALLVDVHGDRVDLGVASRALGLGTGTLAGVLTLDARTTVTPESIDGHVRFGLGNGSIHSVGGVSARFDGRFEGDRFEGAASGVVEGIGAFGSVWKATLAGSPLDARSWAAARGEADVQLSNVELSYLTHILPKSTGVQRVEGKLYGRFRLDRPSGSPLPNLFFVAETKGVEVLARRGGDERPAVVRGIDLQAGGTFDGSSGRGEGTTRAVHAGSVLAALSGSGTLDIGRFLDHPGRIWSQLAETPIDAALTVESRKIRDLPEVIRPDGVVGTIESLRMEMRGIPTKPHLQGLLALKGFTQAGRPDALPVRVVARPEYAPDTGALGGTAEIFEAGRQVGKVRLRGKLPWRAVTRKGGPGATSWSGTADVDLTGLPLGVVPDLAGAGIGGRLFGTIHAVRTPEDVGLTASIDLRDMTVADVPVGTGTLTVDRAGDAFVARAQLRRDQGTLAVEARAGVDWSGALPELDVSRSVTADLRAHELDAVVLMPLFGDALSRLTGDLDANLRARLHATPAADAPAGLEWRAEVSGDASLRDGIVQVAAVGLELRETSFDAVVEPHEGLTVIRTDDLRAKARSERVNLNGRARMVFDGLTLARGTLGVGARDVPLLVEGVSLGDATGVATADLVRQHAPDRLFVKVVVPEASVKLPHAASRNVVSLRDNPDIRIVQLRGETGGPQLAWRVVLDLRKVAIQRGDLHVLVKGQPVLDIADETRVKGYVELPRGGQLPALGKVFTVESGLVRFDTGDPTNPRLQVTASWRAPDATIVYVDVTGTLHRADYSLRSVPALPDAQILALLFGKSSTGGEEAGNPGAVVSTVSGSILELTEVLTDTPYELRADSTAEGRQALTGAYRKGNVTAEVTYAPTSGNSVSEEEDHVIVTTDLRFTDRWSLRYQLGTGTLRQQIDLLWQYRY